MKRGFKMLVADAAGKIYPALARGPARRHRRRRVRNSLKHRSARIACRRRLLADSGSQRHSRPCGRHLVPGLGPRAVRGACYTTDECMNEPSTREDESSPVAGA
jgi:hypothetical protein